MFKKPFFMILVIMAILLSVSLIFAEEQLTYDGDKIIVDGEGYTPVDIISSEVIFQKTEIRSEYVLVREDTNPEDVSFDPSDGVNINATVKINISSVDDDGRNCLEDEAEHDGSLLVDEFNFYDTQSNLTFNLSNMDINSVDLDGDVLTLKMGSSLPLTSDEVIIIDEFKDPKVSLVRGNFNSLRLFAKLPGSGDKNTTDDGWFFGF